MSIGEALGLLRVEFPDVTLSKIRFLESEGLVDPQRSSSGYRKFSYADVERLRFVLSAQRDQYLPLRVIKERLDALDTGQEPPSHPSSHPPRLLAAASDTRTDIGQEGGDQVPCLDRASGQVGISRSELLEASGLDDSQLRALEDYGLVQRRGCHYDRDALTVTRLVAELVPFGLQPRHLRAVKAAVDREIGLIATAVTPLARKRDQEARERADETARELTALTLRLHAALMNAGVGHDLDH